MTFANDRSRKVAEVMHCPFCGELCRARFDRQHRHIGYECDDCRATWTGR